MANNILTIRPASDTFYGRSYVPSSRGKRLGDAEGYNRSIAAFNMFFGSRHLLEVNGRFYHKDTLGIPTQCGGHAKDVYPVTKRSVIERRSEFTLQSDYDLSIVGRGITVLNFLAHNRADRNEIGRLLRLGMGLALDDNSTYDISVYGERGLFAAVHTHNDWQSARSVSEDGEDPSYESVRPSTWEQYQRSSRLSRPFSRLSCWYFNGRGYNNNLCAITNGARAVEWGLSYEETRQVFTNEYGDKRLRAIALDLIAQSRRRNRVRPLIVTCNTGAEMGYSDTMMIMLALRNNIGMLSELGYHVVQPGGWATNPNEGDHIIDGVYLVPKGKDFDDDMRYINGA